MIVKCKGCGRRFELEDKRLMPYGLAVRCSKCGKIFRVYPDAGRAQTESPVDAQTAAEKRKHPRVPVLIPVLCNIGDSSCNTFDICLLKDISKGGVAVELFQNPGSEAISICLIDSDRQEVKICGKVAHSQTTPTGKRKVGVSLSGSPEGIQRFVAKAAEAYRLKLVQAAQK